MSRKAVAALVLFAVTAFCVPALAQTTHSSKDNSDRAYVLVEITGFDVNCSTFQAQVDVNARVAELRQLNAERAKENKVLLDEVKKMNTELAAKKREVSSAKEDDAKAEAQRAVDDLTAQIEQKKTEEKLLTRWNAPKYFSKRADADKYIEQVYKESEAAKERAAKKEAAEKAKAAEKKD